jgi:hypothetical protein
MRSSVVATIAVGCLALPAFGQYLAPTPYLSAADSPFSGLGLGSFNLQNFEPGNTVTGLTALGGVAVGQASAVDSVDADDGAIDGAGTGGTSYYSTGFSSSLEFVFDAAALGGLPTHAGVVWTDVGAVTTGDLGFGGVIFEAFDAGNVSLGVQAAVILGDGSVLGGTAEDRFFGAINAGGISRIVISMDNSTDWEVDHVQYGIIPAPGTCALLGGVMLARVRRRR